MNKTYRWLTAEDTGGKQERRKISEAEQVRNGPSPDANRIPNDIELEQVVTGGIGDAQSLSSHLERAIPIRFEWPKEGDDE